MCLKEAISSRESPKRLGISHQGSKLSDESKTFFDSHFLLERVSFVIVIGEGTQNNSTYPKPVIKFPDLQFPQAAQISYNNKSITDAHCMIIKFGVHGKRPGQVNVALRRFSRFCSMCDVVMTLVTAGFGKFRVAAGVIRKLPVGT